MDENILNIEREDLENLSVEELLDLKFELDDLLNEVEDLIARCDEVL